MKLRLLAILIPFLIVPPGFATLPTDTTVWEVQPTTGVDTNGGCFITGATGTDLTYPTSSPVAYTDLVAVTTTTITSVAIPFSAASVGNCLHIASGTGWTTGWFQIVSVSTVTATVDRAIATMGSTGGTGTLGGALKTMTQMNTNMAANHQAYVKAEATITRTGIIDINFGSLGLSVIQGYTTTRNDNGYVTIQATADGFRLVNLQVGNNQVTFKNFILDCQLANTSCGGIIFTSAGMTAENIKVTHFGSQHAFILNNINGTCRWCYATGATSTGSGFTAPNTLANTCYYCVAYGNTSAIASGAIQWNAGVCDGCIAANNTGTGVDGFQVGAPAGSATIKNSVSYGNTRDGIRFTSNLAGGSYGVQVFNSIFVNNGGYGINSNAATIPPQGEYWNYNFFYNNTLGARNGWTAGANDVTGTGDPFTNGASLDFSLNNTAGAGASARAAGFPGALNVGGTGHIDLGALQHGDPAPTAVTTGIPIL